MDPRIQTALDFAYGEVRKEATRLHEAGQEQIEERRENTPKRPSIVPDDLYVSSPAWQAKVVQGVAKINSLRLDKEAQKAIEAITEKFAGDKPLDKTFRDLATATERSKENNPSYDPESPEDRIKRLYNVGCAAAFQKLGTLMSDAEVKAVYVESESSPPARRTLRQRLHLSHLFRS